MSTPANWCSETPQSQTSPAPSGRHKLTPITASALCSMGWRPVMITGLIRDMLIRHFKQPMNVEEPDLRHLVWREDERTGILIESITRWRGDLVEKRPAIIVKPNGRQNLRLGIGDVAGVTGQGHVLHQTFWTGSHTLFCIHGSGASVDILATEVQRELTQFARSVIQYLNLYNWQVTEVGPVAEVEEARESFVIPITLGWAYGEQWQVELESLKLRKIPLSVLLDGQLFQETK